MKLYIPFNRGSEFTASRCTSLKDSGRWRMADIQTSMLTVYDTLQQINTCTLVFAITKIEKAHREWKPLPGSHYSSYKIKEVIFRAKINSVRLLNLVKISLKRAMEDFQYGGFDLELWSQALKSYQWNLAQMRNILPNFTKVGLLFFEKSFPTVRHVNEPTN